VLNRAIIREGKPYPPPTWANGNPADVPGALAALKSALLLVVTNQPDVARGSQQRAVVESIHEALRTALPIMIFVCYHETGCLRLRKPKPGLLPQAAGKYGLS
jgi:D-glycero-D-manno-heptose 1,7-bisphosphate phosphatase